MALTIQQEDNPKDLRQEAASILASLTKAVSKKHEDPTTKDKIVTLPSTRERASSCLHEPEACNNEQPSKSGSKATTRKLSKKNRNGGNGFAKTFPEKLTEILEYCTPKDDGKCEHEHANCTAWLPHGDAFVITNMVVLTLEILPLFFSNKNSTETVAARAQADKNDKKVKVIAEQKFKSFTRKLYRWGFRQVTRGPGTGSYMHPLFKRNQKEICLRMKCHYSDRELRVQKENAVKAEERRKVLYLAREKQSSYTESASLAINFKRDIRQMHEINVGEMESYRELVAKNCDILNRHTPSEFNTKSVKSSRPIQKCRRIGNRFHHSPEISRDALNIEQSLIKSSVIVPSELPGLGHTPIQTPHSEDATTSLADVVLRNRNIEKVLISQREILLRKQQAALLEQRAQNHFAAATAAAAAASRLALPSQFTLPAPVINPGFEVNMYNVGEVGRSPGLYDNNNLSLEAESRRNVMSIMEKRLMLSTAFKQSYEEQLNVTALLRQRLHEQSQSIQPLRGNMNFYNKNLSGPGF